MVNDERLAKCTSLRDSGCSPPQVVDHYLKTVTEATAGDPNEGCCGEEGDGPGRCARRARRPERRRRRARAGGEVREL